MTWELTSWLLMIVLLFYSTEKAISCRNEYTDKVISVGREAIYEPSHNLYWENENVRFRCPEGYHFEKSHWKSKEYVWIQCSESGWLDSWPTCGETALDYTDEERSKRITLSAAVPLSAMFVILLAVSMLYVRRLRLRNSEIAQEVRYQHTNQTIQFVLPSYEESMKSKPTDPPPTFEETFSYVDAGLDTTAENGVNSSPIMYGSPPPPPLPRSPIIHGSPPPYDCHMDSSWEHQEIYV